MYKEHKYLMIPENPNTIIWRYMDFWKFEKLIESQNLYFSTIKNMGDQFEGRIPDSIAETWIKNLNNKEYTSVANLIELLRSWDKILNSNVLSWNISDNESFALWKVYTSSPSAISIKSNIQLLIDALKKNELWQFIGVVNYFSNNADFRFESNAMNLIFNKFDYYRFENELRIYNVIPATIKQKYNYFKEGDSIEVPVDLNKLIDSIYLAPNATENEYYEVQKLLDKHNLKKDVYISGINDKWSNNYD
jgi:hypothetical protein